MMGGLFKAVSPVAMVASALNKKSDAPTIGGGVIPAPAKKDEPPVIGPTPTLASLSLDQKRKSQTDALGAAGMPQTIIKAPSFG